LVVLTYVLCKRTVLFFVLEVDQFYVNGSQKYRQANVSKVDDPKPVDEYFDKNCFKLVPSTD